MNYPAIDDHPTDIEGRRVSRVPSLPQRVSAANELRAEPDKQGHGGAGIAPLKRLVDDLVKAWFQAPASGEYPSNCRTPHIPYLIPGFGSLLLVDVGC